MAKRNAMFLLIMLVTMSISLWGQFNINSGGTNYTQDFNSLTTAGTWTNNSTLTGWYARTDATASITAFALNTGTTTSAGLYSFGSTGNSDRAFGYVPSNAYTGASGVGKGYVGWRLKNNTGLLITDLTITWTGEQWRKENNAATHNLKLYYQTGTTVTDLLTGTWVNSNSQFNSPIVGATTAAALDGNLPANRVAGISVTLSSLNLAAGDEIMLRWEDLNDTGNDHYLTIDDITVNATVQLAGNIAPSISNIVKSPPSGYYSTTSVSVIADITDTDGTVEISQLRWGTSTGSYPNTINMSLDSEDTYAADSDIPAQADGTTVFFVIYAEDDDADFTMSAEQSYAVSDPKIIVTGALNPFSAYVGTASSYQSYNVQGYLLTGNIGVLAPTGFELCTTAGGSYTPSLSLPNTFNGAVYVRLTGASIGNFSGNIEHTNAVVSQVNKAVSGSVTAEPAVLFEENFNYTAGTFLKNNGWTAHSGADAFPPVVGTAGLTYTNYPSVSGLCGETTNNGEDVHKTFVPQTSGAIYCSFLINVTSTTEAGDYVFHFGPNPIGTDFKAKFFVGRDASNNVRFGITKSANVGTAVAWTGYSYALNTTYLVAIKYVIVSGATNDEVYAWINPSISGPEPTPQIQAVVSETDIAAIGSIAIRQSNVSLTAKFDGIRIAKTWYNLFDQDVVPPGTTTTIGDVDIESEILLYYSSVPINDPGIPVIPNLANLVDPQAIIFTGTGTTDLIVNVGPGTWYVIAYYNGDWQNGQPYPVTGPGFCSFFDIFLEGKADIPVVISEGVDPTLPVELSSFTATFASGFYVQLNWIVQSETNHMGYNIHRSNFVTGESLVQINDGIIESGSALGTQITYTYRDEEVEPYTIYYYWLESVDLNGSSQMFGPKMVTVGNIDTPPPLQPIIVETALLDAYPNPFGSTTSIRYALKTSTDVKLEIYNIKGQLVKTLENLPNKAAGTYQKVWDGNDLNGRPVSSGIYYYRMTSGKFTASKKVIVVK
ncbi:MAG: T9SS type A sorting domain-containing protein [Candidatus Cloacimonetes bacterium]|nr:T9SS type A sorting domain-containing protein [Candidatus Cloacimonadota bacterium]